MTVSEARAILERARQEGLQGQSVVNRSLTKRQAYDIFVAGLQGHADDEPVIAIVEKNIRREFGG